MSGKKDINFIKYIKPQLKEKERVDKAEGRQKKYETACKIHGVKPAAFDIMDIGFIASILRRFKP